MAVKVVKPELVLADETKAPDLPHLDPNGDDWDSLIAFSRAVIERAGLTYEDSMRIRARVRREVYGDRR